MSDEASINLKTYLESVSVQSLPSPPYPKPSFHSGMASYIPKYMTNSRGTCWCQSTAQRLAMSSCDKLHCVFMKYKMAVPSSASVELLLFRLADQICWQLSIWTSFEFEFEVRTRDVVTWQGFEMFEFNIEIDRFISSHLFFHSLSLSVTCLDIYVLILCLLLEVETTHTSSLAIICFFVWIIHPKYSDGRTHRFSIDDYERVQPLLASVFFFRRTPIAVFKFTWSSLTGTYSRASVIPCAEPSHEYINYN